MSITADTYFDFDAETMQIRQRFSESSASPPPVFSPGLPSACATSIRSRERVNVSEDTGFESSSDRSSLTLSHDGLLNNDSSPGSLSPRSNPCTSTSFQWPMCPRTSSESLASKPPLNRYDSKDSVNTTSSFWDCGVFPAETKAVLAKVRDQMRSSLKRVQELEEQAKQIPLLQVKISILQEEKRQLSNQLKSKIKKGKKTRSCSLSTDPACCLEETRSIGVGDHTIHDILCKKCEEIQEKLLGRYAGIEQNETVNIDKPELTARSAVDVQKTAKDRDVIHVFQDRCTQTAHKECKDDSTQTSPTKTTRELHINDDDVNGEASQRKPVSIDTRRFEERACSAIVSTRSVGLGQIASFVRDMCVGEDKEIPTVNEIGVQKTVDVDHKSCGAQMVEKRNVSVSVSPTLISVGTGCTLFQDKSMSISSNAANDKRSTASQTTKTAPLLVSVGVGMFSLDDYSECESCQSKKEERVSLDDILESNQFILSSNSVAVGTEPWEELRSRMIHDHMKSRRTSSVGVMASVPTKTVGSGKQSITDSNCLKCIAKSCRSLGVNCKPRVSDVGTSAESEEIQAKPAETRSLGINCKPMMSDVGTYSTHAEPEKIQAKPVETRSLGVGECCVTDDYCERCFSLQTRNIGVGNGSIFDHNCELPGLSCQEDSNCCDKDAKDCCDMKLACDGASSDVLPTKEQEVEYSSGSERMFSDEYERITDGWALNYENDKLKRLTNPSKEILLACDLLQKHFQDEEHLDENRLLVCMKSIEDYWFSCVTESSLDSKFMSELVKLFKDNLPLLLEGLINSQDENGNTALHYLVTYGKFDCVDELLRTDLCDLNITNKAGYSAVMLGSLKDCDDDNTRLVLVHLFEKGNLNCIAQSTGQTALMLAAGTGNVAIVDLLLQCGAAKSINATDLDGSTALMCACEHGYSAVVKHLLAVHGCDATIKDHDGSTCFSIAMEQNRKDIALMIYTHLQPNEARNLKVKSTGQQLKVKS